MKTSSDVASELAEFCELNIPENERQAFWLELEAFCGLRSDREQMVDITAPKTVEIQVRQDGKVVWVNVDGNCKLRCCRINELKLIGLMDLRVDAEGVVIT